MRFYTSALFKKKKKDEPVLIEKWRNALMKNQAQASVP
jgi:hypothetical protein